MQEIGMTGAELRVVDGKNILDLSDDELKRTRDALETAGTASGVDRLARSKVRACRMRRRWIAAFNMMCSPPSTRFEDQPRLTEHAMKVAQFFGAPIVRVFSYWRTVQPERAKKQL
jgi:L-ribulose-5-phosphate 3-epimerase